MINYIYYIIACVFQLEVTIQSVLLIRFTVEIRPIHDLHYTDIQLTLFFK